jgi:hypothetical protein
VLSDFLVSASSSWTSPSPLSRFAAFYRR